MSAHDVIMGAAGASSAPATYIEDVFSTYLYTGNNSTQTIPNGIDLAGKGGLVWNKKRSAADSHWLYDSARGATTGTAQYLVTDSTDLSGTAYPNSMNFISTGFQLASNANSPGGLNSSGATFASWTFRKQPKFFDVLTYTGNGATNRQVAHSLGSVPGCIIIKRTDSTSPWFVAHVSVGTSAGAWDQTLMLNMTAASSGFNWGAPTSAYFQTGADAGAVANTNINGGTYVAYIFAHNAGGFGLTGTDNVISCGSFTSNGVGSASVTLGYEPQFVLYKPSSGAGDWRILDNMRGWAYTSNAALFPNGSYAESVNTDPSTCGVPTATGFSFAGGLSASTTYIYIAIRRGPMKVPTDGTKVFAPTVFTSDGTSTKTISPSFTPDASLLEYRPSWNYPMFTSRLTGKGKLITNLTDAENTSNTQWIVSDFDYSNALRYNDYSGGNLSSRTDANGFISWCFRRAPGFFDEVCYTGNSTNNRALTHNLTVTPSLIIYKRRNLAADWVVMSTMFPNASDAMFLETTDAIVSGAYSSVPRPTSTSFYVGDWAALNNAGDTYVAYLFASCSGVSKVGSYTGTGATQTINCGFAAGARFVLIKRTDSTGDWYVWDTARGIISGNDPYLLLNSASAEVTTTDYISPQSSGFGLTASAPAALNASGGTYIYLAIA